MLLTTCPNCAARFKVHTEQLNVRQGRVMCGRCRKVFNAFESLKRENNPLDEEVLTDVVAAEVEVGDVSASGLRAPITADDFVTSEPGVPQELAGAAHHVSTERLESGAFVAVRGEDPPLETDPPAPTPVSAPTPHSAPYAAPYAASIDRTHGDANPLLYRTSSREGSSTRAWGWGVTLMLLLLAGLSLFYYRSAAVQLYPQLRPQFAAFCGFAGCGLPWGREDAAIRIETSELLEIPGKPGHILLTATLVNKGSTRQDLPYLEVRLTDNANQVLVSRNLTPAQYQGRAAPAEEGLAPNAEVFVNLHLEIANKLTASGYALRPFYP